MVLYFYCNVSLILNKKWGWTRPKAFELYLRTPFSDPYYPLFQYRTIWVARKTQRLNCDRRYLGQLEYSRHRNHIKLETINKFGNPFNPHDRSYYTVRFYKIIFSSLMVLFRYLSSTIAPLSFPYKYSLMVNVLSTIGKNIPNSNVSAIIRPVFVQRQ